MTGALSSAAAGSDDSANSAAPKAPTASLLMTARIVRPSLGDARTAGETLDRDRVQLLRPRLPEPAQIPGEHLGDRPALLLVDRGPAGDLVALAGLERLAAVERHVGDA